ncbi:MAG: TMEM14 family protein [Verrucomicrobiota bacterium]|nr:TMEM14 family protein [Verrucomicrobiota bacterium]
MRLENLIFWTYVILLLAGGLIGFFKAGSKVSLLTSAVAAALLVLTRSGIFEPVLAHKLANVIMAVLLVVFAFRLAKTKKFMPSGLLLALTILALAARNLLDG